MIGNEYGVLREHPFVARAAWDKVKSQRLEVDSWNKLPARGRNLATALGEACVLGNAHLLVVVRDCLFDVEALNRQMIMKAFNDLFGRYGAEISVDDKERQLVIKQFNPYAVVALHGLFSRAESEARELGQEISRFGSVMVARIETTPS